MTGTEGRAVLLGSGPSLVGDGCGAEVVGVCFCVEAQEVGQDKV